VNDNVAHQCDGHVESSDSAGCRRRRRRRRAQFGRGMEQAFCFVSSLTELTRAPSGIPLTTFTQLLPPSLVR
jgi:hypothetical protein